MKTTINFSRPIISALITLVLVFLSLQTKAQVTFPFGPAIDELVECDGAGNITDLNNWLNNHGYTSATTSCASSSVITWSDDFTALSDGCGETGTAMVTFTATDNCGFSNSTTASFTIEDTQLNVVGLGNYTENRNWHDEHVESQFISFVNSNGRLSDPVNAGLLAFLELDDCSSVPRTMSDDYNGIPFECDTDDGIPRVISYSFTDECGNVIVAERTYVGNCKPYISFENSSYSVYETAGSLSFCFEFSETFTLGTNFTFDVVGGTATDGVDYSGFTFPTTEPIPAGQTAPLCFNLTIANDGITESPETIEMAIASIINGPNGYAFVEDTITITIQDFPDADSDGVADNTDNCPNVANPLQADVDNDGIGNACDNINNLPTLMTVESNIYLSESFTGAILTSPDGNCWIITVNNMGQIETASIACP